MLSAAMSSTPRRLLHSLLAFSSLLPLLVFFLPAAPAVAEPVQYCKFGASSPDNDKEQPKGQIDFCMSVIMYQNASSSAHDMYLSMSVTRRKKSALGWTAIGVGQVMKGALMLVVYGDPVKKESSPTMSFRGATGNSQPRVIDDPNNIGGADLRLISSAWSPSSESPFDSVAEVSMVCYSCNLWPADQKISAEATAHPWMWAWNEVQEFSTFANDAPMRMHRQNEGAGGYGNFYVDMARSINTDSSPPQPPVIHPKIEEIGTSSSPSGIAAGDAPEATAPDVTAPASTAPAASTASEVTAPAATAPVATVPAVTVPVGTTTAFTRNRAWHLHGFIMSISFLLFLPTGIFAVRSGSPKAFRYHWVLQLGASSLILLGVLLGLYLAPEISTIHQRVGLAIALSIVIQGLLGWRHHMVFLRIRRRTWLSHFHIWLGRFIMLAGYSNLISGMLLREYSSFLVLLMGIVAVAELSALVVKLWRAGKAGRSGKQSFAMKAAQQAQRGAEENYFALDEDDADGEEEDDDNDDDRRGV